MLLEKATNEADDGIVSENDSHQFDSNLVGKWFSGNDVIEIDEKGNYIWADYLSDNTVFYANRGYIDNYIIIVIL